MEMQDKEFDELFRSKLDDFEAEPSAGVWMGIKNGLVNNTRKKYLLPLLSVTASILILITAGVLLMPHDVKTQGKNQNNNTIAKTLRPVNANPGHISTNAIAPVQATKNNERVVAATVNPKTKPHIAGSTTNPKLNVQRKSGDKPAVKTCEQEELASVQPKQQEVINPVVPDDNTPLVAKRITETSTSLTTKPVIVTAQLPVSKDDTIPVKAKHKIHTLGDFINVVVAKVDKHRNQLIQFSDDDDDDSIISTVDRGISKIKNGK